MRFIFAGTTEFGIPTLEKLIADGHELLFVITQPDKPFGRKQELNAAPIKKWAQANNVRVLQPDKISELHDDIALPKPDVLLVAAYGQIIPKEILDLPRHGSINIHGSVLPKYRGASPIQAAILHGDTKTGITLLQMDEKMDHGPILATKDLDIAPEETFQQLYRRLSELSAEICSQILPQFLTGQIQGEPQEHSAATFTKLLRKEDARIDWTGSAVNILNQVRALNPEPGTWTTLDGKVVKILEVKILPGIKIELPGKLFQTPEGLAAKASDASLILQSVQPAGGNVMTGAQWANGIRNLSVKHFI
ncbi:MAG TPA: methionyl-tRNA formyltransferase [Patescibacteria group bacterium]|nr:methionyl-tRNA formyltransferase [Patescibacteria group bacterium]